MWTISVRVQMFPACGEKVLAAIMVLTPPRSYRRRLQALSSPYPVFRRQDRSRGGVCGLVRYGHRSAGGRLAAWTAAEQRPQICKQKTPVNRVSLRSGHAS